MMLRKKTFSLLLIAISFAGIFFGCSKKWDDHDQVTDSALKDNLLQAISKTANLGKFSQLMAMTGYDKIISSSKTYTVWAPTDQALQTLDASILNDTVKLKLFVGNHISNQAYLSGASSTDQRIQMLNGKYIVMSAKGMFDSANITTPNRYASNGVFHIIDKFIPRQDNIWELLNNTTAAPLMKSFLLSLNYLKFDPSLAVQTGVDASNGLPIYKPGTGYAQHNTFLDTVLNVADESNLYTMILLTDNAYTTEYNKITPWFKTGSTDSTSKLSGYWLVKDLAFKGLYTAAQLPDTMISLSGVKVPINKAAITASYRTSNGIVHIMNQVNFTKEYKFPSIIIQGENPTYFSLDRSANTFYRIRKNPTTGQVFNDILLQNYNVASYFINYNAGYINSMRYNAYWVAVNDVQTTPLWQQRLALDSTTNTANFPAVTVAYQNYTEVKLGAFTISNYRNLKLFVIGPTTASSTGGNNSISLDYIRLEPAF